MKDKEKQIEEIAITMCAEYGKICNECDCDCDNELIAEKLYNAGYRKIPEDSVVVVKELLEYWKDKATNQNGLLLNINGAHGWFPKEFIVKAIETYKSMKDCVVLSREEYENSFDIKVYNKVREENRLLKEQAERLRQEIITLSQKLVNSRKETAEKIWRKGKEFYNSRKDKKLAFNLFAMWIENEFGIEIKE